MAVLASKGTASVTLAIGETLNVLAGGQGVAVLKGGALKGQSVELGASVRKIGPFPFAMPITINSQNGAITYYVGADSAAPHVEITAEYDGASGNAALREESKNALDSSGYGTLASKISAAYQSARNNSPLDLAVMASPPTVTVGAAAITNGQAYNYFDTDGHKRIRIKGVPFGDASLMCENVSGYLRGVNIANSGGSFSQSGNAKHYLCEVTFTGQIIQFIVNGLSAGLIRFRVNGALVSASQTSVGNSNVQLDFGATVYNKTISMEFEQSQTVKGVVVGPNDTIYAIDAPPIPVVVTGDSYIQGTTSPVTIGAETYCGCLRDASGLNVLALGVGNAGYIKPGTVSITNSQWLARIVAVANAANAPLILITMGTNDYGLDAAAIQAAAVTVGATLLSGTGAKIAFIGPWPQNRNNDAGSLAVEAAIQAAAASLDQNRVGFIPVCSGGNPWVKGQGDNDTAPNGTSIAYGNSAIVTGNDGIHPYPGRGSEYLARKTIDALIALCATKGW